MTWAQRLKEAFGIDIEHARPAAAMQMIAGIGDPDIIAKILTHLDSKKRRRPKASAAAVEGNPTTTWFGLSRKRRGNGVGRPERRQVKAPRDIRNAIKRACRGAFVAVRAHVNAASPGNVVETKVLAEKPLSFR